MSRGLSELPHVHDYDAYRDAVRELRASATSYATNCFALPREAKGWFGGGRAEVVRPSGSCLLVVLDRGAYRQLYVHADVAADLGAFPELGATCVAENPFTGQDPEAVPGGGARLVAGLLRGWGFALGRRSHRLKLTLADRPPHATGAEEPIEEARGRDLGRVARMLDEGFDPLYDYIPSQDELARAIDERRVLVTRGEEGQAASLLHFDLTPASSELRQLYVSPGQRGKGVARALVAAYLDRLEGATRCAILWLRNDNLAAQAVYTDAGYGFSGRCCEEYVRPQGRTHEHS